MEMVIIIGLLVAESLYIMKTANPETFYLFCQLTDILIVFLVIFID